MATVSKGGRNMTITLYCDNKNICEKAKKQIATLCSVPVRSFANTRDFITAITGRPDLIMLIIQEGTTSTETAMLAKEWNPDGKLLWFCDLDFALLSFRLKAIYFGLIPVENEKLKTALSYCGIKVKNRNNGEDA